MCVNFRSPLTHFSPLCHTASRHVTEGGSAVRTRLERVYQALLSLGGTAGVTAQALADAVGIDRSNASRELNRLVLLGRARKVPGKPVRFLAAPPSGTTLAEEVAVPAARVAAPARQVMPVPSSIERPAPPPARDPRPPLDGLPGARGSLKNAIAQAKAAVLYPGGGLATLILGPTGVGKSLFAEEMYRFAVTQGVLPPQAAFVVFNCADYASNPQLLLSQLFGAARGAYTGAAADRPGVVEQAAGGILFLDEVHRLPPEGQEMLFLLLDRGLYRRLGETRLREVQVRVICATTEEPESSLLATFLRRIPMVIHIPSLAERPLSERLELVLHCFQAEADRIGKDVVVSGQVISHLVRYTPRGNVGQLKAEIQLACARAFLEEVRSPSGVIRIQDPSILALPPEAIGGAEPPLAGSYRFMAGAGCEPGVGGESIYERIARRVQELDAEGRAAESVTLISAEIDAYFAGVTRAGPAWQQVAEHLVGPQVLAWAGEMLDLAREKLGLTIDPRVRVGLAMHIASTLERVRQGKAISYPRLRELKQRYPQEVAAAAAMAARLQQRAGVTLPPDETGFLASFLLGLGGKARGQVGVLVACHGRHTASAMVETVRELIGEELRLAAVDWPLGEPLEQLLLRAEAALRQVSAGQGVLVLADMGPLLALGELLTERTGVPTRTVASVSVPKVLEAVRKARAVGMTLDDLARLLTEGSSPGRPARSEDRPVVLALCLTGEGSARHMAGLLREQVPELADAGVEVLTGSLAGEKPPAVQVAELARRRPVLAVVSTFDPGDLPVPVILLEELLRGAGAGRLRALLAALEPASPAPGPAAEAPLSPERQELLRQMTNTLARQLKAVDAGAVVTAVGAALTRLEATLGRSLSFDTFAGMAMHLACFIDEQAGRRRRGAAPAPPGPPPGHPLAARIGAALSELEAAFGVEIPAAHLERMARMLGGDTHATPAGVSGL
jgi:transcriptional regulator with AAA-type ATPase domain/transcriptional regulatory protein LevR